SRNYFPNERTKKLSEAAIGKIYRLISNYDSSMYYLAPLAKGSGGDLGKTYISCLYIDLKQYDKALPLITEMLEISSNNNANVNMGYEYTIAAQAYLGLNDYPSALRNARAG